MLRVAGPNRWNEHSIVNVEDGNPQQRWFQSMDRIIVKKAEFRRIWWSGIIDVVRNSVYNSMRVQSFFFVQKSGANVRCQFFSAHIIFQHCKRSTSLTKWLFSFSITRNLNFDARAIVKQRASSNLIQSDCDRWSTWRLSRVKIILFIIVLDQGREFQVELSGDGLSFWGVEPWMIVDESRRWAIRYRERVTRVLMDWGYGGQSNYSRWALVLWSEMHLQRVPHLPLGPRLSTTILFSVVDFMINDFKKGIVYLSVFWF